MPEHPNDKLYSEEFDLEEVDASSLSALFAGGGPSTSAIVVDFEDEDDDGRPSPAFGTLAEDEDDAARPHLSSPSGVFEPLTREEQEDDVELPPLPQRRHRPPAADAEPSVAIDEYPQEEYSSGERKLSLRDRLNIAKGELSEDQPAVAKEPKAKRERKIGVDLEGDTGTPGPEDTSSSPKKSKKLSRRARQTPVQPKPEAPAEQPDEDAPPSLSGWERPLTVELGEEATESSAKKEKLSLRERLALAKQQAKGAPDEQAPDDETPEDSFPASTSTEGGRGERITVELGEESDEAPSAEKEKLSLRERLALAKQQATKQKPVTEEQAPDDESEDGFPAPSDTGRERPVAVELGDDDEEPSAAKKEKLSLRERLALAKQQATKPKSVADDLSDPSFADDDQDTSLVSLDEEPPAKMSLKQRLALAKKKARSEEDASDADIPDEDEAPSLDAEAPSGASGLKGFWAQRKAVAAQATDESAPDEKDPFAGLDLTPPSTLARVRDRFRSKPATNSTQPQAARSRFGELLTPLSKAELQLLRQDVQQDEPLFVRIEQERKRGANRQQVGFLIGLLSLVAFGFSVGPGYLTEILPQAPLPESVFGYALNLDDTADMAARSLLFGLGLLLPLIAAAVIAEAVKYLWRGLAKRRYDDMLLGCLATICAGIVFSALQVSEILAACGGLLAWMLARGVIRTLSGLLRRGEH